MTGAWSSRCLTTVGTAPGSSKPCAQGSLPSSTARAVCVLCGSARESVRQFNVNFERRNHAATVHLDLHPFGVELDVFPDHPENFLAELCNEIGLRALYSLMSEKYLQSFA